MGASSLPAARRVPECVEARHAARSLVAPRSGLVGPPSIPKPPREIEPCWRPKAGREGLQLMCEGGGMADATLIERI